MDATKIQAKIVDSNGVDIFNDATLTMLENGWLKGYKGKVINTPLFLQKNDGTMLVTKEIADAYNLLGIKSDMSLDEYLESLGFELSKKLITPINNTVNRNYSISYTYNPVATSITSTPLKGYIDNLYATNPASAPVLTIGSLQELKTFLAGGADSTNKNVILTNDINVGSESLTKLSKFSGTFDGNGHKIIGLETTMFGELNGATVKNLTLEDVNIETNSGTGNKAGALADIAEGTTLDNISISGSLNYTGEGVAEVGGLIGGKSSSGTHSANTIKNITCSVNVTTAQKQGYAGGIIGGVATIDGNHSIENCVYNGTINSTCTSLGGGGFSIGGIVGSYDGTITNCKSEGNINTSAGQVFVGGIVGVNYFDTNLCCKISNCTSSMTFGGSTPSDRSAGIIGAASNTIITNCYDGTSDAKYGITGGAYKGDQPEADCTTRIENCNSSSNSNNSYSDSESNSNSHSLASNQIYLSFGSGTTGSSSTNGTLTTITNNTGVKYTLEVYNADSSIDASVCTATGAQSVTSAGAPAGSYTYTDYQTGNRDAVTCPSLKSIASNIEQAFHKAGITDIDSSKILDWLNSKFSTNNVENNKILASLNTYLVNYLDGTSSNSSVATALQKDIKGNTTSNITPYSISYSSAITASRSSATTTCTRNENVTRGQVTIPNKSDIKSMLYSILKQEEYSCTEAQVSSFVDGLTDQQLAALNDDISHNRNLSTIANAVNGGTYSPDSKYTNEDWDVTFADAQGDGLYEFYWDTSDMEISNAIAMYLMAKRGFEIVDEDLANSNKYINNMINEAQAVFTEFDPSNISLLGNLSVNEVITESTYDLILGIVHTSVATNTVLNEVSDTTNIQTAQATYESDMAKINRKETRVDTELSSLDTERNAIKTEKDTLKTVAKDNVDLSFKLFS